MRSLLVDNLLLVLLVLVDFRVLALECLLAAAVVHLLGMRLWDTGSRACSHERLVIGAISQHIFKDGSVQILVIATPLWVTWRQGSKPRAAARHRGRH